MDSHPTHLMDPLVHARALLQGNLPPDVFEGTITRDLLTIGNVTSNVIGMNKVPSIVGDGVHSGRQVVRKRREDSWVPSKATQKEVLMTKPSNGPSLI